MVIPDGHDENHTLSQSCAHCCETTLGGEQVLVTESSLLSAAESVGDGVTRDTGDSGLRVGKGLAILNVEALDFAQGTGGCTILGDELGDDGEWLGGVDCLTSTVEGLVAHSVGVEITSVGITEGGVSCSNSAVSSGASENC
jgi:hypothetical protein